MYKNRPFMAMLLLRRFSGSLKKAFKASEACLRAAAVPLAFYIHRKFDIILAVILQCQPCQKLKVQWTSLPDHQKNENKPHSCLCSWHVTFASCGLYTEFAKACLYNICMYIAQLKGQIIRLWNGIQCLKVTDLDLTFYFWATWWCCKSSTST